MPHLFGSFTIRGLTLHNRIAVSPMCEYSCDNGMANAWHAVHLGSRAVGGAALVFTEATAITAEGRITAYDLGIWSDAHAEALAPIVSFIRAQGGAAGIQLAHAGRKGSTARPWEGGARVDEAQGGWQPVGPTDQPFADYYPTPRALDRTGIHDIVAAFARAAERARDVGFQVIEIHAAHGYLLHEFLSPLTNTRTDEYGGSFDHRIRLCLDVVDAVRKVWPEQSPLFVRISSTDWAPGGWDIEQSIALARRLRERGVDVIDCSSGGLVPNVTIPLAPGYQVPFAERIRREAGIATGTVGLITTAPQANDIIVEKRADIVLLARELLRDPYWPLRAARELDVEVEWPVQYLRAAPTHAKPRTASPGS